uniref:Uncharacterized protein n=1 Tax=Brassica oleracea TaxID=3712 RepID=A0A3P6D619_BRAOL|nr:unnamed protein product [Brassica oleracea]
MGSQSSGFQPFSGIPLKPHSSYHTSPSAAAALAPSAPHCIRITHFSGPPGVMRLWSWFNRSGNRDQRMDQPTDDVLGPRQGTSDFHSLLYRQAASSWFSVFLWATFLGNFRWLRCSKIPDANSEEYFVGTSEDWTIGNFLGIYRGSPPSVYSDELSDDLVVLGVSSEIQFLGIPSEISEGFPRKNEFPRSYFRGLLSSVCRWNSVILTTYRRFFPSVCRCFLVV